jgi:probable HAF family extracellular repeat protein
MALAVVLAALVAGARAASTPQFQIVDLGTLSGPTSLATAINDGGQVAGVSLTATAGEWHAFVWTQAEGMIDLGSLGGTDIYQPTLQVNGINESGQVVGWSYTAANDWKSTHAFSWTQEGGMIDLGTLGGSYSAAESVNVVGQVVGESHTADGSTHAFSWTQEGGMVDLGTFGGSYSVARAVNDDGQVVGESAIASGEWHAFSWTQEGGMLDLGTLGGSHSGANDVNDSGQVVGYSFTVTGRPTHAFSWTRAGGMIDLTLGDSYSWATDVNDDGQVVGSSASTLPGDDHAFSWTKEGGMIDLGTLGGSYSSPFDLNNGGQVVGASSYTPDNYFTHAFSWTQTGGLIDLGTLGGPHSYAVAVNDGGQVVGWSGPDAGATHAVLWNPLPQISVSGHGRFNTEGNGQVTFTLSNEAVSLERIRGQRFSFTGEVESVTGADNHAALTGTGSYNGKGGYAFEVSLVDKASWGRLEDTISVVIRDPAGAVVFTSFGPQLLKQGDIVVTPADSG